MRLDKVLNAGARFIRDPEYRFRVLEERHFFDRMPDEKYLKARFRSVFGRELDLDRPKTFNEKLQWLKLYDRKPEYTIMVDKYLVREYIAETLGEEYLIPLLGVWDRPEDIDFDALPDSFVLKCNHNSGTGMYICKDKRQMDKGKVIRGLNKGLKEDYYLLGREWPYKDVPRKIICEKYMQDGVRDDLMDYKFMCFNGRVECVFVCTDRFSEKGLRVTFFDRYWNRMPFERHYPKADYEIAKPIGIEKMISLAERLAKDLPFVRVDLYEINGAVYFGELTFFPGNGYEEFEPEQWDETLGSWIELPKKKAV